MKVSELITILQQHSSLDVIGYDYEYEIGEIDLQLKKIISTPLLQLDGTFKDGTMDTHDMQTIDYIAREIEEYSVENRDVYWEKHFNDSVKKYYTLEKYIEAEERRHKNNVETLRRLNEAEWVVSISCK